MIAPVESPAEIFKALLEDSLEPDTAPGGVVVGGATDAQQQAGCIVLTDAGMPRMERYLPLVWIRTQVRILAPTVGQADYIARAVWGKLVRRNRLIATQPSTGKRYLIHSIDVVTGPSMHADARETREELLFAEWLMGTEPVE